MISGAKILQASIAALLIITSPTIAAEITFTKDIAPIFFHKCASCHRPGQTAPFSLLTFGDAKKHAPDIAEATRTGYMPPWLPEAGEHEFLRERRLTAGQIALIQDWVSTGASEGNPSDLPPTPNFPGGWLLGPPDLIAKMPEPYSLAPDGQDLYRNFVLPTPSPETRFVRAFEFHPGNRSVHHVRIRFDPTRQSRRLDAQDEEPGFSGMNTPAKFPPGHMTTWVPGQEPALVPEGLFWTLGKEMDIVLQIHLQRTGKRELIQPEIGFYFTNRPPSRRSHLIGLTSELIEIPAGDPSYFVERRFELPAGGVQVLSVLPHMHYLGKEAEAFATLPSGKNESLLRIKNWDFNWQGEYRFREPVSLPSGSVITMRYRFDNSAENPRNPSHPPRPVYYGPQSTDEMAELWLQVVPNIPADLALLQKAQRTSNDLETVAYYEKQLSRNPRDAAVHTTLGKVLGPMGKLREALGHFALAVELEPNRVEAHYYLGLSLLTVGEIPGAREEFESVLRLDPRYEKAHDGLGLLFLRMNKPEEAAAHFDQALQINPDDPAARENLHKIKTSIAPKGN
ncbi:MAG TPA: tetratricopeptide repeat protein [Verrucomicrobiae bacterium]|nr:tetratricopeptide repeat protein [Verrucomicrobiae bacterium]